uniref:Tripartite motif-containing protein 16-like n=1 Tax=Monopterus albus TaxID=43700 RepID=A0A3Q3K8J1_MONAL
FLNANVACYTLYALAKIAQQGHQEQKKSCCAICLDLLKDPVTVPCGHNYCMSCIQSHLDEEDQKETHSCPLCRQTFVLRPTLVKNTMLSYLVKKLKKTGTASADHCHAGPGDVACDVCTERKLKAVKSCLHCLVSYCEQHLQPHYKSPAFEKHKLVNPAKGLQENICSRHNEVIKIFCRTDQMYICYLCYMDEHKGHNIVTSEAQGTDRQKEIEVSWQKIQQRIQTREEGVNELQQQIETIEQSADQAVEDSEMIINKLVHFIKEKGSDVKQQIRLYKITEVSRAKELQEKLEQEITELRRKDPELQQLSHTENHAEFQLSYLLQLQLSDSTDTPRTKIHPVTHFEGVPSALSKVSDKVQDFLREKCSKVSLSLRSVDVLLPQEEPKGRNEFLKYSCQLTLDPNTAHKHLYLSDGDRMVLVPGDRFHVEQQVLSKEALTGRCYWEVEWSGEEVSIAVTYKNNEELDQSGFGENNKSWALDCFEDRYKFRHDQVKTHISGPQSSRVGVYLDHMAGVLSFYSVSDTMTLLCRVTTTFTQPVYAGIWIWRTLFNLTTAKIIDICLVV